MNRRVGDQLVGQQLGLVAQLAVGWGQPPGLQGVADKPPSGGRRGRVGANRSSWRRYPGRSTAASTASWRVSYSGRNCPTLRPPRTAATAGWAPHNNKLVAGQRLAGWLARVAKTLAQTGSRTSTPPRSQMTANGCSARSLSRARWTWGALARVIWPVRVTTRQPSRGRPASGGVVGDGAIGSTWQIGSTPNRSLLASMEAIIWAVGGRAPPRRTPPRTSGSHWPGAARGPPTPGPSDARAPRSSGRAAGHHRSRPAASSCAVSPAGCRTWPRSSRSPPTARDAHPGARTPVGRPARAAPADTSPVWSWLQPLTSRSL